MSESIPTDILRKAEAVYDDLGRGSGQDVDRIARAIMAERRRCESIAEELERKIRADGLSARKRGEDKESDTYRWAAGQIMDLRAAIRKGGQQ